MTSLVTQTWNLHNAHNLTKVMSNVHNKLLQLLLLVVILQFKTNKRTLCQDLLSLTNLLSNQTLNSTDNNLTTEF